LRGEEITDKEGNMLIRCSLAISSILLATAANAGHLPKMSLSVSAETCYELPGGGAKVIHHFGTVNSKVSEQGAFEKSTASASPGPNTVVSASTTGKSSQTASLCGPENASSANQIAFRVTGPDGNVHVDYLAAGSISRGGKGPSQGLAEAFVWIASDIFVCAGDESKCEGKGAWTGDQLQAQGTIELQANKVYYLTLQSDVEVGGSDYNGTLGATLATQLAVNAADAGSYTIEYSPNFIQGDSDSDDIESAELRN
jgi:hypothetical protein